MPTRVLLAVTALLAGVSAVFLTGDLFTERSLPNGFKKPVMALEFTRDAADVERIVGPADARVSAEPAATDNPDRRIMRSQLAMDRVLIGAYTLFFVVTGVLLWRRRALGRVRFVGLVAVAAGLAAAFFDVRENESMRLLLDSATNAGTPATAARLKWGLFFIAAIAVSPVAWKLGRAGTFIAVLFAGAGVIGAAMAVVQQFPTRLGLAVSIFGGAVLMLLLQLVRGEREVSAAAVTADTAPAPASPAAPDHAPQTYEDVLDAEYHYIRRRRFGHDEANAKQVKRNLVGLALSGGGIRSATTNLGILQTLSRLDVLPLVDYVSTVSGGGYIGSCLTSLLSLNTPPAAVPPALPQPLQRGDAPLFTTRWDKFPFNPETADGQAQLRHLRTHGSFLVTRKGVLRRETLRSVGQLLSGTVYHLVLTLLCLLSIALLYMTLLFWGSKGVDQALREVTEPVPQYAQAYEVKGELKELPPHRDGRYEMPKDQQRYSISTVYVYPGLATRINAKANKAWEQLTRLDPHWKWVITSRTALAGIVIAVGAFVFLQLCDRTVARKRPGAGESAEDARAVKLLRWTGGASLVAMILWLGFELHWFPFWWAAGSPPPPWTTNSAPAPMWLVLPIVGLGAIRITTWILHVLMPRIGDAWNRDMRSLWGAYQALAVYALWAAVVLALIPVFAYALREHTLWTGVSGIVSLLFARALTFRKGPDEKKWPIGASLLRILLGLAIGIGLLVIVIALCGLIVPDEHSVDMAKRTGLYLLGSSVALLLLSVVGDANRLSPHYFYRDRLAEAYLFTEKVEHQRTSLETLRDTAELQLKDLHGASAPHEPASTAPYHLISCAINLAGSRDLTRKDRKSGYFLFSKYFCGSRHTGFRPTAEYGGGTIELSRAITISGAAASSGIGQGTFFAQAFATVLFNLRLGYWMANPKKARSKSRKLVDRLRFWPRWLWKEITMATDERKTLVNLSDGGHTGDNVGIYPLLQRRCKLIIACDAEADPRVTFGSFTEALRHAYIDLGIDVDIDLTMLRPDTTTGMSRAHSAVGLIRYPGVDGAAPEIGYLVYLKNCLTGDEQEPVLNYKSNNPAFPHESTADQFFDDAQFESYRALGVHIAEHAFAQWTESGEFKDWRATLGPMNRAVV